MKKIMNLEKVTILLTGLLIGVFGVMLFVWGNPLHTGICISCFMENIAGALGLHHNIRMQYLRPEIMGLVLGSLVIAFWKKEFRPTITKSPLISFVLGIILIIGGAVFVGCPIKVMLNIGRGEIGALFGFFGLITGILIGIQFLKDGYTMGEPQKAPYLNGLIIPGFMLILLLFLIIRPSFILFSTTGPGSLHAPFYISFFVSIIIGVLAQQSRFCVSGSIRNFLLAKDASLLQGTILLLIGVIITNILTNNFEIEFLKKEFIDYYIWGFFSMLLVGWASAFSGGCHFRQLILAGEGNVDSGICVLGMLFGGAIVQNFNIKTTSDGISLNGQITVLIGFIFLIIIGLAMREKD